MHDLQNTAADPANHVASSPGELIINGTRYGNTKYVAALFSVSERTISRWVALRVGPARIKIGKLVLFNLDRLPEWLARHEQEPLTEAGRLAGAKARVTPGSTIASGRPASVRPAPIRSD
jgi:hypothetical protein